MSRLSEWFGFSRRERRASFILIILILSLFGIKVIIDNEKIPIEYYTIAADYISSIPQPSDTVSSAIKPFDPNIAPFESLLSAGLSRSQAMNIINFRNSGGVFRKPEDIYLMYSIDSATAERIIPYIILSGTEAEKYLKTSGRINIKTDINISDSAGLVSLPGIGPVLASRIIKYRKLLGGFVDPAQLKEVYGITDTLYSKIEHLVTADSTTIRKIAINNASFYEISRHPYIGKDAASAIVRLRKNGVKFRSMSDLTEKNIIIESKAKYLKYYLNFSGDEINEKF